MLSPLCFLLFALLISDGRSEGRYDQPWPLQQEIEHSSNSPFIVEEPEQIVGTKWGEIRVLLRSPLLRRYNVGLGFITLKPRALLLPHYIDASFAFLVQQGSARIGWVDHQGQLLRQDLGAGDVYAVAAGSLFYLLSTDEDQELKIYGVYDVSDAVDGGTIEHFFVAGESNLFSGFERELLEASFKVSQEGVIEFFSQQSNKAIVPTTLEAYSRLTSLPESWSWSWKNIADFILHKKTHGKAPRAISLSSSKHSFANRNGCVASTHGKIPIIRKSRLGVSSVNLKSGAFLAPHWNPQAFVIGVVTNGNGKIQIAHPNGTNALDERLSEGTIFAVPRYFPHTVLASRDTPIQFLGFTVSDAFHKHGQHAQFLTGRNSVLQKLDPETVALAFNMPEALTESVLGAQQDEIILYMVESEM